MKIIKRSAFAAAVGLSMICGVASAQNSLSNSLGGEKIYSGMQQADVEALLTSTPGVQVLSRMNASEEGVMAHIWGVTANDFPIVVTLFCEETLPTCYFMNFFTFVDLPTPTLSMINNLNAQTFVPFELSIAPAEGVLTLRGNMLLEGVTGRAIASHLELMPAVFVAFAQALGNVGNSVSTELGSDGADNETFDLAALQVMRYGALGGEAARLVDFAKADVETLGVFEDAHKRATLMKLLGYPGK